MDLSQFEQDLAGFRDLAHRLQENLDQLPPQELASLQSSLPEVDFLLRQLHSPLEKEPEPVQPDAPAYAASSDPDPDLGVNLIESITDGLVVVDRDWRIRYINRRAAHNGLSAPKDLIGKDLWESFPSLIGGPLEPHYRNGMDNHIGAHFVAKGTVRDLWYSINVYPIDEGILIYAIEDSARKEVELDLAQLLEENQQQKALLDSIFEADPGGIAVLVGSELTVAYANAAYRFISPFAHGDLVGKTYESIWSAEVPNCYSEPIREALNSGRPFQTLGFERHFPDGTTRIFTLQARRIDWAKRPAVLLVLWDTTLQSRSEQALRESEARMIDALESTHDSVLALDRNWRITYANQRYAANIGRTVEGLIGKNIWETLTNYAGTPIERYYHQAMEERIPVVFETGGYYSQIWYEVSIYPTAEGISVFSSDRTQEKRAAQALRESQEYSQRILETANEGILIADVSGIITYANPCMAEMLGYSPAELVGKPGVSLIEPSSLAVAQEKINGRRQGLRDDYEIKFIRKDGSTLWARASGSPLENSQGQHTGNLGMYTDITEIKRAEQALRESEERYRELVETSPAGIYVLQDERYVYANPVGLALLGCTAVEQLSQTPAIEFIALEYRELIHSRIERGDQGESNLPIEIEVIGVDGSRRRVETRSAPIQYNGRPALFVQSEDITARKQSESETRANAVQIEIQRRLLEQREQERQQIARDLHDGPVQEITGAAYAIQGLILDFPDGEVSQQLEELRTSLQAQVGELRSYAQDLRPPTLSKFGLEIAIRSHLEGFQEKYPEIQTQFDAHQEGELTPEHIRLALFRIYQQAMNNVVKHAHASEVRILLSKTGDQLELEVRDNGTGFEIPQDWLELARHGHLGLVGMRERAEAIGGTIEMVSHPLGGTRIHVIVPFQRSAPVPADNPLSTDG